MKKSPTLFFIVLFLANFSFGQSSTICSDQNSTNLNGTLFDSGGPGGSYSNNEYCGFLISPECADSIILTFNFFDLESGWDYLYVFDGEDENGTVLLSATGTSLPSPVVATSGKMFILFDSDGSVVRPGFEITWQTVQLNQNPVSANFSISNNNPDYQETISFTDLSTSDPVNWFWDFGDGETSTEQNPSHYYLSSGTKTVTLISSNCNYSDTFSQNITVNNPPLLFSEDTFQLSVQCNDGPVTSSITFYNNGSTPLGFEIPEGDVTLDTVLNRINRFNTNLTSLVPSLFLFTDGVTGSNISDGGNDMYDGGNRLNTNFSGTSNINYSDNTIISSANFGTEGQYFTRKVPGLFVLAADLDNVTLFNITGNLGADGSGNSDGAVLNTSAHGSLYTAFINRTFNAGDPSINRMIIVQDNPSAAHTFLTDTDNEDHEVTGLADSKRLYYLLFASQNGNYVNDTQMQAIFEEFVSWLGGGTPSYMNVSPKSDTLAVGDSVVVNITIDPAGLNAGNYEDIITINTTTDPYDVYQLFSSIDIFGNANLTLLDTCINYGAVVPNNTKIDSLAFINTGCDNLTINDIISSNGVYSVISFDTNLAPGETGIVVVEFTPVSVGSVNANLTISTNIGDSLVCLTGLGSSIFSDFNISTQNQCSAKFTFTDVSVGNPTSWLWNFGDGNTSTLQNPSHGYANIGSYTVELIVCNQFGCDTSSQTVNAQFILEYEINYSGAEFVDSTINFEVVGANVIAITWNFGDNTGLPGLTPSHVYSDSGTYIITASVTTSDPCIFTLKDTITILPNNNTSIAEKIKYVNVYPNPSNGKFKIDLHKTKITYLEIVNSVGQQIYFNSEPLKSINLNVDQGIYLLKIYFKDGSMLHQPITILK